MQRLRIKRTFSRVAMTLVVMLLTTATAWAIKTETPVTYTVSYSNNYITIRNGSTTTASWSAKTVGGAHYWAADDSHNLSNGMTVKSSADVSVTGGTPATQTSTTFTFTAPSNIAITGVTFKNGNNVVDATSSEPGSTFTVTLPATTGFNSFTVTFGNISGTSGSATWTLSKENKKYTALTIGGSGAMNNYSGSNAPWGTDLTTATIGSSITSIGNYAFNGCTGLTRVNIQKTDDVVSLGTGALSGCNALTAIVAPTPALAVQYQSASNWSDHASKLRVPLGSYLFAATNDGGTAAYAITNADDLRNLSAYVNASTTNISSGMTFRQTAPITLSSDFTPIGTNVNGFQGTYDGGGFTISGLSVSSNKTYAGLFGNVRSSYATVKNVCLVNPSVTSSKNDAYIGTIVGYLSYAHIENCWVYNPTVNATGSQSEVGAIIGRSQFSSDVLTNLYFYDSDGSHSYAAVGGNGSNHVTNVGRARKVTIGSGISSVSPADASNLENGFQYQGYNYYREGLELTVTDNFGTTSEGYTKHYNANGTAFDGSTYTVNSTDGDVTLTAAIGSDGQPHEISYIDEDGKTAQANAIALDGTETSLAAGTYFVGLPTVSFDHTLYFTGNADIILADGCTMNVGTSDARIDGMGISSTNNLTIYGQALGSGHLNVYSTCTDHFTRYGSISISGDLTLNSGNVTVRHYGNEGVGVYIGNITINGGSVTTDGSSSDDLVAIGHIIINGGTVNAAGDIWAGGNINLGWTNYTDHITAGSYIANGIISVAHGKKLTDGSGNILTGRLTADDIDGKTLYPYIENLALTANAHDGNYWTTFYCGHTGYKINDGENAWAYTATVNGNELTLHKLGKVIPKNTAVIVVGADSEISMTASTDAAENDVENDLQGVDVRTLKSSLDDTGSGTFYVLSKQNGNFGFFEYTGDYMPARKAYLLLDSQAEANGLTMVFDDETTALTLVNSEQSIVNSGVWYDMQGRKQDQQPTTKGLYINNGKMVVIK